MSDNSTTAPATTTVYGNTMVETQDPVENAQTVPFVVESYVPTMSMIWVTVVFYILIIGILMCCSGALVFTRWIYKRHARRRLDAEKEKHHRLEEKLRGDEPRIKEVQEPEKQRQMDEKLREDEFRFKAILEAEQEKQRRIEQRLREDELRMTIKLEAETDRRRRLEEKLREDELQMKDQMRQLRERELELRMSKQSVPCFSPTHCGHFYWAAGPTQEKAAYATPEVGSRSCFQDRIFLGCETYFRYNYQTKVRKNDVDEAHVSESNIYEAFFGSNHIYEAFFGRNRIYKAFFGCNYIDKTFFRRLASNGAVEDDRRPNKNVQLVPADSTDQSTLRNVSSIPTVYSSSALKPTSGVTTTSEQKRTDNSSSTGVMDDPQFNAVIYQIPPEGMLSSEIKTKSPTTGKLRQITVKSKENTTWFPPTDYDRFNWKKKSSKDKAEYPMYATAHHKAPSTVPSSAPSTYFREWCFGSAFSEMCVRRKTTSPSVVGNMWKNMEKTASRPKRKENDKEKVTNMRQLKENGSKEMRGIPQPKSREAKKVKSEPKQKENDNEKAMGKRKTKSRDRNSIKVTASPKKSTREQPEPDTKQYKVKSKKKKHKKRVSEVDNKTQETVEMRKDMSNEIQMMQNPFYHPKTEKLPKSPAKSNRDDNSRKSEELSTKTGHKSPSKEPEPSSRSKRDNNSDFDEAFVRHFKETRTVKDPDTSVARPPVNQTSEGIPPPVVKGVSQPEIPKAVKRVDKEGEGYDLELNPSELERMEKRRRLQRPEDDTLYVTSTKSNFVIIKLLGEGGFGAVYRVHDQKDKSLEYAMKVEKKLERRKHSKLKMEIAILKLVSQERDGRSHFTKIIDRGRKDKFFFLVMQLVGKSLADLKIERPNRVFSLPTGIGASIQCLEAVEDLHKHGYIHRDLKPANYSCGLGECKRMIYILDFGIARRFLNNENALKTPRNVVGFKGTIRFASLACHRNSELGPKDDCESWFYLLLDLIAPAGLPWRKMSDKKDVQACKEECRSAKREKLFQSFRCKEEFGKLLDYIDSLKYHDKVDYSYIYQVLKLAAEVSGVNLDDPFDWETANPIEGSSMFVKSYLSELK
ncbi:hypothetical protein QR680_008183 [Steinernema hermaphroditum]|uniref:Protein kinase domain-containing protein n=1 Tax=Steinernema hermaphroditum TaxID=289476 RepID=A0AA39IFQ0_9BILA|nr:hypothetical protein QR680_008183 [Steinernema hermaphroditum]